MQNADNRDIIFVYAGGVVPEHLREIITHARVDKSVRENEVRAFSFCPRLYTGCGGHDRVERVGEWAFRHCPLLRRAKFPGLKIISEFAFDQCRLLRMWNSVTSLKQLEGWHSGAASL